MDPPDPGGETADEVSERLNRVVDRCASTARALVFAHGDSLRALTARWLGSQPRRGEILPPRHRHRLGAGFERDNPALLKWNW